MTVGIGGGVAGSVTVNWSKFGLIAKDAFQAAIYLPTLAKGYKMDLMTNDARNRHYLDKSITAIEAAIQSAEEELNELERQESEDDGMGASLLVKRGGKKR